jgi:urease accessory protein
MTVLAHTNAGETTGLMHGMSHPVGGADHLLAMLAVGLWAVQTGGRAVWIVPAAFVMVMILGGVLGFSGIAIPFIEEGILVSVLVLGTLIAGAFKFPIVISTMVVGVFAIFHGHAHGTEMPLAMGAFSYSIGFALATAMLHVMGMAAGFWLQKLNLEMLNRVMGGAIALSGIYLAVA